jgi:sigma-B regulation protein RsbU (phosphoserine phosphatase)
MTYSNSLLSQESVNYMFVTVFYGIYNIRTGEVTYTNAGHNPPYLIKANGTVEELPLSKDIVAGAIDDYQYTEETLQLEKGDTLLLYTDGVTEAVDAEVNDYSEDRLKKLLDHSSKLSCQEVVDKVKADVKAFVGEAEQSDDITLLALKRL